MLDNRKSALTICVNSQMSLLPSLSRGDSSHCLAFNWSCVFYRQIGFFEHRWINRFLKPACSHFRFQWIDNISKSHWILTFSLVCENSKWIIGGRICTYFHLFPPSVPFTAIVNPVGWNWTTICCWTMEKCRIIHHAWKLLQNRDSHNRKGIILISEPPLITIKRMDLVGHTAEYRPSSL